MVVRRMLETPTTTTSQKSIAIHLQFVLQYASDCIAVLLVPLSSQEREILQSSSHLYRSTPSICIAIRLPSVSQCFWGKSWWLSPGCSPLSGPLNRLNAILSLLLPSTGSAIGRPCLATGSAIGRPCLALSLIHAQVGVLDRLKGSTARLWCYSV